jgi:hypothetical protein
MRETSGVGLMRCPDDHLPVRDGKDTRSGTAGILREIGEGRMFCSILIIQKVLTMTREEYSISLLLS